MEAPANIGCIPIKTLHIGNSCINCSAELHEACTSGMNTMGQDMCRNCKSMIDGSHAGRIRNCILAMIAYMFFEDLCEAVYFWPLK